MRSLCVQMSIRISVMSPRPVLAMKYLSNRRTTFVVNVCNADHPTARTRSRAVWCGVTRAIRGHLRENVPFESEPHENGCRCFTRSVVDTRDCSRSRAASFSLNRIKEFYPYDELFYCMINVFYKYRTKIYIYLLSTATYTTINEN